MNVRERLSGNKRMNSPETWATLVHTQKHKPKQTEQSKNKTKRRRIN